MQKLEIVGELSETELRAIVPELQSLTERYKRAEKIQKALYSISELSSSSANLDSLYPEIHNIVQDFMTADNFFVAFHEKQDEQLQFAYFVDERDQETMLSIPYEKIKNGITAHILRSGNNLVMTQENFQDLAEEHQFEILGTPPVDLIGVPLKRDTNVIGAMVVQSYNENVRYSEDDLEILVFICQHIVTTVDRVKSREVTELLIRERTSQLSAANQILEEEINERKRMEALQKALFEISELSAETDKDIVDFYKQIHDILKRLINAPNCYIAILDETREYLSFPYFVGQGNDSSGTRRLGNGLTEYVIGKGEACLINAEKIKALSVDNIIDQGTVTRMIEANNSWLGAPLILKNQVEGVISVQTYGHAKDFTEEDLNILRFVSQHIAVAMERRRTADELKNYNKQLAEKVKERTAELNLTNESLQRQIDQRKEIESKLIHDAHHDALTGLPNRVMFTNRLELAISSKQRHDDHNYALLFIDLDRFKAINDTLGHHAGDQFLIEVAERINKCKRSHDLLARLGGDEFVVLIDTYSSMRDVELVAQRIVDSIGSAFVLEGKEVFSGASIGIAELISEYNSADDALRDADAAMYQAKNFGRNRFVVFDMSMRNQLMDEIELESDFRQAFKSDGFDCFLQAICELDSDQVLYYENTIQWHCDRNGLIKGEDFWKLANQCGLTFNINQHILEITFEQLKQWQHDRAMKDTKIGVSLSVEHLLHKKSMQSLMSLIDKAGINSELLVIELSEHSLSKFNKYLPTILGQLQSLGVSLVLDNFGSKTASLSYFFDYDFDFIKLSEKLVNTLSMSDKYHTLVKSVVEIADKLGVAVIGDGIDDPHTQHELQMVGCQFGQGPHVSPETPVKLSTKH